MAKDSSDKLFESLLAIALALPLSILGAWGVMTIWNMFLVPARLPALTLLPAWGFIACASLASQNQDASAKKDESSILLKMAIRAVAILFAVGFALLVHLVFA